MTHEDDLKRLARVVHDSIHAYCDAAFNIGFDPSDPVVRLQEPSFGAVEITAAVDCLLTAQVTQGDQVRYFEAEFGRAVARPEVVMSNSGASANLLAIAALTNSETEGGLNPGDEVIVPALSWATTVWPLIQLGLVPVVVDIDPHTLAIDPAEIEKAITPRSRAVVAVHVNGNPCDMAALSRLCEKHNLILIEDCGQALGASYGGRPVGSFGRVGTFSFYYSHHITTIEGGMSVTDDFNLAETMRMMRAHGRARECEKPEIYTERYPGIDPNFLFVNLGYNVRPTEPQAAMGAMQLMKLDSFVDTRRRNAAFWQNEMARYAKVLSMQAETPDGAHSWFGIPVVLKADAPFTPAELRNWFGRCGIETRSILAGNIAAQPAIRRYAHRVSGTLAHADAVMKRGFSFGNHQAIDDATLAYVAQCLQTFMGRYGIG